MSSLLRLEVTGRCAAIVGQRTIGPNAEQMFAGLLALGLERGRRWSRTELAALLWPDVEETVRRGRLRWLLAKARSLGLAIEADSASICLARGLVQIDLDDETIPSDAIGELFPGYAPQFSRAFSEWFNDQRDALTRRIVRRFESDIASARQRGDWAMVRSVAGATQRLDSQNEQAVLSLAEAQCRLGLRADALANLKRYVHDLGDQSVEFQVRARALMRRIESAPSAEGLGEVPFVGRVEQLRRIELLLRDARHGQGGALILTGPPGIGKTRLLDEARVLAAVARMQCVRIRCHREDAHRPLSGIADLVPQLLELPGAAGCQPENLRRLRRFAVRSEGGDAEASNAGEENPEFARSQLVGALIDLLGAVSSEAPLVLQLDDAQWVDQSLRWLWQDLLMWSQTQPVAWLFGFRTSRRDAPALDAPVVPVGSLELSYAIELLDGLAPTMSRAIPVGVRDSIVARGAGSPLFICELVRQWAATGIVEDLPSSLHGLVERGLANLSSQAVRTLQVAAILGAHATVERIENVASMPRKTFVEALVDLDSAGVLTTDRNGFVYGHVLWAEAALAGLAPPVATVLHMHAARQFDAELLSRPDPVILWEIARHWNEAGQRDHARRAILRGAEHLIENGFPAEAAASLYRAEGLTKDDGERLQILRRRIDALHLAGCWDETVSEIDRHEVLARECDTTYSSHNALEMLRLEFMLRHHNKTEDSLAQALSCARDPEGTPTHRLHAARLAARFADVIAPQFLPELNTIAMELGSSFERRTWDWLRVRYMYERRLGSVLIACSLGKELVDNAHRSEKTLDMAHALHCYGETLVIVGRLREGREAFEKSLAVALRFGYSTAVLIAYDHIVGLSFDVEPPAVTRQLIDRARATWLAFATRERSVVTQLLLPLYEAMLALGEGRNADALSLAPPLADCLTFQVLRQRARLAAIHLAGRLRLGESDRLPEIAAAIATGFESPDDWLDWPAAIYAEYLEKYESREAASHFARRFVREIRRELYPPPEILKALADSDELALVAVV